MKKARSIPDQNILQFDDIREKIKDRILNEKLFQGLQAMSQKKRTSRQSLSFDC